MHDNVWGYFFDARWIFVQPFDHEKMNVDGNVDNCTQIYFVGNVQWEL